MALSKPFGDVIAEELKCSICLDRLESPRMLMCHHSFCQHCLEGFANLNLDGFLHCPTCRERTVIPNVGITGLKPDFRANKLLEALNEDITSQPGATMQHSCSLCKSFKACLFCDECDLKMCQGCAEFHLKMPTCRNHQTVPLTDLSSESVPVKKSVVIRKCPRHDERFKFYCKTCSICICADCTVLDHSKVDGHECVYLKEIVQQQRRDVAKLVTQVDMKAKDLDSFFSKIVATKQVLDQKSSDIAKEIEIEVAKIKTMLLEQSKDYVEKNQDAINDIEQRNRSAKIAIEEVARVLHQVSSSKDDLEVAGMHHNLLESVRKMTGIESDATTLDNLQTEFKTLTLKCTQNSSSHHSSINLVEQKRVLERQNVPHATRYYAVGKKDNGNLSVVYATDSGQVSCHNVQKEPRPEIHAAYVQQNMNFCMREACPKPNVYGMEATLYGANLISSAEGQRCFPPSDRTCCLYDILPNGQICCIEGDKLFKGSTSIALNTLCYPQQREVTRHNDKIHQGHSIAVSTKEYVYVATSSLDYLLEIAPNNIILPSKPFGNIIPLAITTCNTSPCETILIASKPASVSLIDGQQNIRCIFSDREGVVWENAALTCSHEGRVYLLSSQDSKITLQILDKEGNLHETIFRDRPLSSQKPPSPEQTNQINFQQISGYLTPQPVPLDHHSAQLQSGTSFPSSGFGCRSPFDLQPEAVPVYRPPATQSTIPTSSPATQQRLAPRLSIAVACNGDIAAVLDENELFLITLEEIDLYRV
eukprot:XP_011669224.1 PREDICTED: uncharacterized protein LOC105440592 [Strongylocentrotus purpuratus]